MKKSGVITGLAGVLVVLFAISSLVAEKAHVPQTICPVMGGKIDKSLYVDAEGKRIYVCCQGCIDKVKADPKKYIAQLEKEGITLEAVPCKNITGKCCFGSKKCSLSKSAVKNP